MEGKSQDSALEWQNTFSKSEINVGCAKSAKHQIWLKEYKPFRKRVQWIPLGNLEDLHELLNS